MIKTWTTVSLLSFVSFSATKMFFVERVWGFECWCCCTRRRQPLTWPYTARTALTTFILGRQPDCNHSQTQNPRRLFQKECLLVKLGFSSNTFSQTQWNKTGIIGLEFCKVQNTCNRFTLVHAFPSWDDSTANLYITHGCYFLSPFIAHGLVPVVNYRIMKITITFINSSPRVLNSV